MDATGVGFAVSQNTLIVQGEFKLKNGLSN
jgi:hypothetical protein